MRDDLIYVIELPDETVWMKVPRMPDSMKARRPFVYDVAAGYPVAMVYNDGSTAIRNADGRGSIGSVR